AIRAVQRRAGAARVLQRDLAGLFERPRRGDAHERAFERPAGECMAHDRVLSCGQDQRQRRRPLAQVDARDLPGLDRVAGAVEYVVGDLEGDPERKTESAELLRPELARGFEELPGL